MGAEGMVTNVTIDHHPKTNTERPKIANYVTSVLSLARLGTQLLGLSAQSLVESSGTLIGEGSYVYNMLSLMMSKSI